MAQKGCDLLLGNWGKTTVGKHLFQISANPHSDQLYFGYENVNHDIQMQNVLHFVTVFIVSGASDQVLYGHVAFWPVM